MERNVRLKALKGDYQDCVADVRGHFETRMLSILMLLPSLYDQAESLRQPTGILATSFSTILYKRRESEANVIATLNMYLVR